MPIKDRLGELQKASKYLKEGENTVTTDTEIEMKPLNGTSDPSDFEHFLVTAQDLATDIGQISQNVGKMRLLQKKIKNTPIKSEREKFQAELADIVNQNKSIGKKVQKVIKDEKDRNEKLSGKKSQTSKYQSELHIRRVQINTHSQQFLDIWRDFNNLQEEYRDQVKQILVTNIKITGCNLTDEQIEDKIEQGDMTGFSSILEDTNKAKDDLMAIQNRHEDFIKLEKGIVEIHDMFIEISNLVSYQGEVINRIEDNVLDAQNQVENGRDNLKSAQDNQKSARKKQICLISTGIIVLLIVLLIILSEFGAFSGSSSSTVVKEVHHYHMPGDETIVSDEKLNINDLISTTTTTTEIVP